MAIDKVKDFMQEVLKLPQLQDTTCQFGTDLFLFMEYIKRFRKEMCLIFMLENRLGGRGEVGSF